MRFFVFAAGCDFSFVLSILHFEFVGRSRRGEGVRRPLRNQRVAGSNLNKALFLRICAGLINLERLFFVFVASLNMFLPSLILHFVFRNFI